MTGRKLSAIKNYSIIAVGTQRVQASAQSEESTSAPKTLP
jgi:hypothetical protein